MKKNNELKIAIGTLLFYMMALPCLDACSNLIQSWIAELLQKSNLRLANKAKEFPQQEEEVPQESTHVIGFQIPNESEEEYEEDY